MTRMFKVSLKERQNFLRISLKIDLVKGFMLQPRLHLRCLKSWLAGENSRSGKINLLPGQVHQFIAQLKMLRQNSLVSKRLAFHQ
jgi:myo-inositol catabolism protein IolC